MNPTEMRQMQCPLRYHFLVSICSYKTLRFLTLCWLRSIMQTRPCETGRPTCKTSDNYARPPVRSLILGIKGVKSRRKSYCFLIEEKTLVREIRKRNTTLVSHHNKNDICKHTRFGGQDTKYTFWFVARS